MRLVGAVLWLLFVAPAEAECWGADTRTFPTCGSAALASKAGLHCSGSMCANTTCSIIPTDSQGCDECFIHYPNATLDPAHGLCCVSIGSGGRCIGPKQAVNPQDDDDLYHGNVPVIVKSGLTFGQTGAWLSVAADVVALAATLGWSPQMMKQMRPRMLMVLLVLDALAGLFDGLQTNPKFHLSRKYDSSGSASVESIFDFVADVFYFSSFTWTALIATHALAVVTNSIEADSAEERKRERRYWGVMLLAMGCAWLPVAAYLDFGRAHDINGQYVIHWQKQYNILGAVTLVVQWVWVGGVCLRMHFGPVVAAGGSAEAQTYKQQVLLFMLAFFVLTVQQLAFSISDKSDLDSTAAGRYLNWVGSTFIAYTGLANAVVWGLSRSLLYRCYLRWCKAGDLTVDAPPLSLPLLDRDNSTSDGVIPSSIDRSAIERRWAGAQALLSQGVWVNAVVELRSLLDDDQYSDRLQHGHKTIAQALSYALYMQARDLVLAATQSSSSVSTAIALVKESQQLIERFEINFAGRIRGAKARSLAVLGEERCIVSFPGKYMAEWTELVQDWEESIACVFYPAGSPNYGKHVIDPDSKSCECYCHHLYGQKKLWGCKWFERWLANVQAAVAARNVLVVCYFGGQVGQGKVRWEEMAAQSQLRDAVLAKKETTEKAASGTLLLPRVQQQAAFVASLTPAERHCLVGLGGSQKAEVAWLDKMGYKYEEWDVTRCSSRRRGSSGGSSNSSQLRGSSMRAHMRMTAAAWREKTAALLAAAEALQTKRGFLD